MKIEERTFGEIVELIKQGKNVKIETPFGFKKINDYFIKKDLDGKKITFDDGSSIKCSITHFLLKKDKNKPIWESSSNLKIGDEILKGNLFDTKKIVSIEDLKKQEWIDFNIDFEEECYVQNNIVHHNSGKSFVLYVIIRYLLSKGLKGVLVVPTINLVEQMYSDFKEYGWKDLDKYIHKIYSGKEKEFKKDVVISTWQSLKNAMHLLPKANFVIIDESHVAKSDSLNKILKASVNAEYKIGLTGTLPQNSVDKFTLLSTLGKPITIITPQELINQGYATPVEVVMFFLNYNKEICKEFWQKCKTYQQEVKFIEDLNVRNIFIAKIVNKLSLNKKENNLILYNKITHGETLLKEIIKLKLNLDVPNEDLIYKKEIKSIKDNSKYYIIQSRNLIKNDVKHDKIIVLDDLNIFFIRGDVKGEKREEIRKMFELKDGGILIATFGTLSTGVNIKKIHNIHLVSSIKSFIILNQSIGRGMRQHESKEKVKIFDYVDDFTSCRKKKNYILKHADERINLYLQNSYPIIEKEIQIGD